MKLSHLNQAMYLGIVSGGMKKPAKRSDITRGMGISELATCGSLVTMDMQRAKDSQKLDMINKAKLNLKNAPAVARNPINGYKMIL